MKSLEELKKEVFHKLSKYPKIEAFFKDSLEERMRLDDNWIENALVYNILDDRFRENHPLFVLIDSIYADKRNFEILKTKLTPKDDYDRKMYDVLAELNGYSHLRKSGFEEIEALHEDSNQKKPDFSATLDKQLYLFEVKNIRSPIDLRNILWDKYFARKLHFPDVYLNVNLFFKPSTNWRDVRLNPKEPDYLYYGIISWLGTTFQAIESANFESAGLQPFEAVVKDEKLKIQCIPEKGGSLGMIFGFDRGICISDSVKRKNLLYPFIKKIIGKVGEGVDQLIEFDQANNRKKYVLINWQESGARWMFFEKECRSIVSQVDTLVKSIVDNLFVKLLNFDTLP